MISLIKIKDYIPNYISGGNPTESTSTMEGDMQATFDNCNNFNVKLQDTLKGLITANGERKSEIEALRNDHEDLKKVSTTLNGH